MLLYAPNSLPNASSLFTRVIILARKGCSYIEDLSFYCYLISSTPPDSEARKRDVANVMKVLAGKWWKDQYENEYDTLVKLKIKNFKNETQVIKIFKKMKEKG